MHASQPWCLFFFPVFFQDVASESSSYNMEVDEEVDEEFRRKERIKDAQKMQERESNIANRSELKRKRRDRMTVLTRQLSVRTNPLNKTVANGKSPRVIPQTTDEERRFLNDLVKMARDDDEFLFGNMSKDEHDILVECMEKDTSIRNGEWIFREGDVGEYCYAIERGTVEVTYHQDRKRRPSLRSKGQWFGRLALLYDYPRFTSVQAKTDDLVLWKIYQPNYRKKLALMMTLDQEEAEIATFLRETALFADHNLPKHQSLPETGDVETALEMFANTGEWVQFRKGDRMVQKGVDGRVFYIIQEGEVRIHGIGIGDSVHEDDILEAGDWFGEQPLITKGGTRTVNATALSDTVTVLAVDKEIFENCREALLPVLEHKLKTRLFKTIPVVAGSDITEEECNAIAERMQELSFSKGQYLDQVGTPRGQILHIIQRGEVSVYDGFVTKEREGQGKTFTLLDGDYFGDKHIIDDPIKTSTDNVVCEADTICWSVTKKDLIDVIGNINRLGKSRPFHKSRRRLNQLSVGLDDIEKVLVLGEGGFSKVWLVRHKETEKHYALKSMHKRKVLDKKQTIAVMREKDILSTVRHPFVAGLLSSFQDETHLYLLLPLVQGGELYSLVANTRGMGMKLRDVVFYASCILEALTYFHKRLICYRDLKPENVLIDKAGYCVIVDLGFAKVVTTKTFTLLGTPEYLVRKPSPTESFSGLQL